jgi:adenylate cyclase
MGLEIERKFLPASDDWRSVAEPGQDYRQGYLSTDPDRTVRVRVVGDRAWLTIKGRGLLSRVELEYPIPVDDAFVLFGLCAQPPIEKVRHRVPIEGHVFEIDEFLGAHAGLVLIEVELSSEDEAFPRPAWLGREVTGDGRYSNSWLSEHPGVPTP